MYLYVLYGLRCSVGVLRGHMCKYSLIIAFNLCALKFCKHARKDQQERHQEKCTRIPSPEHGGRSGHPNRRSSISGICAICRQSATDQRKRSARARTVPGIDSQRSADRWRSEKQASKLWNREISDQNPRKNFLMVVGIFGKHGAFKSCRNQKLKIENFLKKFWKLFFFSHCNFKKHRGILNSRRPIHHILKSKYQSSCRILTLP